jgi:hypothetical protein
LREVSPEKKIAVELLVVSVTSPMLVGIYRNGELLEEFSRGEKTSEALPPILHDLRYRYDLEGLYYAKGPGSFMAIKVTYVMLKSFSVALDIPLYATDAFAFNRNRPIKAIGSSCFVKKGDRIVVEKGCRDVQGTFSLPRKLDPALFSSAAEPLYILPAV